jgi:hypothetical protein
MFTAKSLSPEISRSVTATLLAATLFAMGPPAWADQVQCPSSPTPKGAWAQQGGAAQFLFEAQRVVLRQDGEFRAATILSREPCKLVVRDQGVRSTWTLTGDERTLRLDQGKGALVLAPLPQVPSSLDINPLPLPPLRPVPAEKVKDISQELTSREHRDQETATKAEEKSKRPTVVAENIRYLRDVVGRYGWIDISRFGKPAAAAAILIAKHADDVPLMQVALPIAERDAKENGGGKELVSILVDEVLITTGHKQKYGTQIAEDGNGKPYVVPVEDLNKVDENRKALGISSWSDYLKRASQALYNGAPIRLPRQDE